MRAKLTLDGKEFDLELKRSVKSTKEFKKEGEAASETVGAGFMAMAKKAGLIGAAITAVQTIFEGFTSSTQAQTDAWGRTVAGLTTQWEAFKASIFTPAISTFADDLSLAIDRAERLYDAMDKLANVKMSAAFATSIDTSEIKELMTIARDKSRTPEERQAAIDKARVITGRMQETGAVSKATSFDAVRALFAQKAGVPVEMVSEAAIREAFRLDATLVADSERDRVKKRAEAYAGKVKYINKTNQDPVSAVFGILGTNEMRGELIKSVQGQYATDLVKNAALHLMSDEELSAAMEVYRSYVEAMNAYNEKVQELDAVQTELTNYVAGQNKAAAAAAAKRRKEAAELEAMRADTYKEWRGAAPTAGPVAGIAKPAVMVDKRINSIDVNPYESFSLGQITEQGKALEEARTSVDLLSESFSSLGNNIKGSAGMMLEFAGNTLEGVQSIISLIGYIQAEKVMHDKNATAAMKEAAAKTLSAYAGIPFAGIALGLSAVSALFAVMQSLPKFANGGIVTSATLGVFGEAGPEAVMPLDRLNDFVGGKEVKVTGELVGRGKDLAAVINNYESVRRIR